ncbi:MAG TPA: hypothetical protein VFN16_00765 [Saccharospirillum sp.]|nr:hypothetical protein [Saccharospirillum sp.]
MHLPVFLAFEVTDEDQGYPYSVAWSLNNGQYKSVLLKPEDAWLIDWDSGQNAAGAPPLQDLLDRGETVLDVIKEWAEDFSDGEVYSEDPALAEYCLDMMYDAYDKEVMAEVIPVRELFSDVDPMDLDDQRRWIMETEGLMAVQAEDTVRTFIHLYAQVHGLEPEVVEDDTTDADETAAHRSDEDDDH